MLVTCSLPTLYAVTLLSAACWSFTVGDEYYENGLDPAREHGKLEKMTMLSFLSRSNTKVSSLNTEIKVK